VIGPRRRGDGRLLAVAILMVGGVCVVSLTPGDGGGGSRGATACTRSTWA